MTATGHEGSPNPKLLPQTRVLGEAGAPPSKATNGKVDMSQRRSSCTWSRIAYTS
jgi:hypothetical protein